MLLGSVLTPILIPPGTPFWQRAASALLAAHRHDLAALRVIVPTFPHAQQLKLALAQQIDGAFIAPRINTLEGWLALQTPQAQAPVASSESQRLMTLYAELRQHAWLKNLFGADKNTDLLPLSETLLTLSDELTQALLPGIHADADGDGDVGQWQQALAHLSAPARKLLSDESQLVWSIWKGQLDANDAGALRFDALRSLAAQVATPLVWINPVAPDQIEQAFLNAYADRQAVQCILLDWRADVLDPLFLRAWPELLEAQAGVPCAPVHVAPGVQDVQRAPPNLSLCPAKSLEHEAQQGAQTIIDWLQEGKSRIALVAQDRVVARRIRALLERAQVLVTDETGWKLSTTRAASALAAWFEVVSSRAETTALLDFIKSPFVFADVADKPGQVMAIEHALRKANVLAGWESVNAVLQGVAAAPPMRAMARQAALFVGFKTMQEWSVQTRTSIETMGIGAALAADMAGQQLLTMLAVLNDGCQAMPQTFSFAEWRACVSLEMEATPFVATDTDQRVVMLPLNGARLRSFDAVLMVGCDADSLPSRPPETLFFANAVRRELGLATRESRQRQQLRDFTELLCSPAQLVLSWQAHKNGEPNALSPWLERLQLVLARHGTSDASDAAPSAAVPVCQVEISTQTLMAQTVGMPHPAAAQLTPGKLSASGYNRLIACPYRFFASHMLHLSELEELSDLPEKRDYGGWLHEILHAYHEALLADAGQDREALLRAISQQKFDQELAKNAAALGYYARWQKVLPAYLQWAAAREAQGWRYREGEQEFKHTLQWDGGEIVLRGRIDRIDDNADGELAVLDYKTSSQTVLRNKLKDGEDLQLPFYGLLCGTETVPCSANFVALELTKDKTGDAEASDYIQWQQATGQHIQQTMGAILHGAPLPANGIEAVCQYCEVRGLCRKGAW
jgi:ATP-dependent helicase/nuclease subunit B